MISKVEIIPAVIGADFRAVEQKFNKLEGLVEWAQLDVMDGLFAPTRSFNEPELLSELVGKLKIEAHLMIEEPEHYLDEWLGVVDRVIVHYEATTDLERMIETTKHLPVKLGVALLLDTPIAKLEPYLDQINLVQLMSIAEIGAHGHPLEAKIFEKIKSLRQARPDVIIAVDGGVNLKNAPKLIKAGANRLVVGSAIWASGDIAGTIKKFQNLI